MVMNKGFQGKVNKDGKLPPGQSEVIEWPVLTYGPTPHIKKEDWSLTINGAVNTPVTIDWKMLEGMHQTKLLTDIHCVTRWSRLGMEWEGVSLDDLITLAGGLTVDAHYMIASGYGGYTTNLPVNDVMNGKAMIATSAHGEQLTPEHGGPARLFIPHLYFWKSAKWVDTLTFTPKDHPGFWEVNGYHNYGDPWREQRYDTDE